MKKAVAATRFGDLVRLLRSLESLHEELLTVVRAKVEAMKLSDVDRMGELAAQEQGIARRIHEREGFRRQLMDAIGEQLGLPPRAARALSASQLAARLTEPQCSTLVGAADRLRECIARVAAANRVAGAIARQVTEHLKWAFAAVKPGGDETAGYSGKGTLVSEPGTKVFDAVG